MRGAVASFGVRMQQAGFAVDPRPAAGAGLPARVDAGAVDHAICNLLDNAVKYSGELAPGGGAAAARRRRRRSSRSSDHGIGIPRSEQERIFERFYRVCTGAVHEVRGVGLGLAIVHHIVAAHGGTRRGRERARARAAPSRSGCRSAPPAAGPGANPGAGRRVQAPGARRWTARLTSGMKREGARRRGRPGDGRRAEGRLRLRGLRGRAGHATAPTACAWRASPAPS